MSGVGSESGIAPNSSTGAGTNARTNAATNSAAFARAQRVIPGGVNSPVRAFGAVGGTPRFIARAAGPFIYDVEGQEYVDLVGSWGPALLGHAHPAVVEAVAQAAGRGLSFGAPTVGEVELAEAISARVPPATKVRFVSTGTEATMTAVRLARGITGRPLVVKFAGNYHGHVDALLAEAGSGVATGALPGTAGVTPATAAETLVLPYNDLVAVREAFTQRGSQIAAVIVEAAPANMGVVPPLPGFNATLAALAAEAGALFILDEVLTGFRVSPTGWWGLEAKNPGAEYVPDLFTFGKVIGGGLPVAALGGRAELLDQLAPVGPIYQAGTLSGNPVAVAAGLATLRLADAEVYRRVDAAAAQLADVVEQTLTAAGVPYRLQRAGSLFSVFFGEAPANAPVLNYADARLQDVAMYRAFFQVALNSGVYLPPSPFEAWFVSAAHDGDVLERIAAALPQAAQAALAAMTSSR